ncbi:UNVERIFIED_CONTAM: hypothetical protein GTU68_042241 [Idotea baltica]|nr:hypothetical protein [Idotea baltica]
MKDYLEYLKSIPEIDAEAWVAPNATVIGNVKLASNVSVWYNASLRADYDRICIGSKTNIQEGVIMHVDKGMPIQVGEGNTIGHGAILHGCTIGNYNLIGMRATVLNGAKIGNYCVIGAHALVKEHMVIPDFSMVLGTPGKIVKQLPEHIRQVLLKSSNIYKNESSKYLGKLDFDADPYLDYPEN